MAEIPTPPSWRTPVLRLRYWARWTMWTAEKPPLTHMAAALVVEKAVDLIPRRRVPIPPLDPAESDLLDDFAAATQAALDAHDNGDMQAWVNHASRAAVLHEEIAQRLGWSWPAPNTSEQTGDGNG